MMMSFFRVRGNIVLKGLIDRKQTISQMNESERLFSDALVPRLYSVANDIHSVVRFGSNTAIIWPSDLRKDNFWGFSRLGRSKDPQMSWPGVPRFFSLRKDANTHSNGQFVTGANQTRLRFQREYYNLMPKAQLDCRIFFFFLPWAEFDSLQRNVYEVQPVHLDSIYPSCASLTHHTRRVFSLRATCSDFCLIWRNRDNYKPFLGGLPEHCKQRGSAVFWKHLLLLEWHVNLVLWRVGWSVNLGNLAVFATG